MIIEFESDEELSYVLLSLDIVPKYIKSASLRSLESFDSSEETIVLFDSEGKERGRMAPMTLQKAIIKEIQNESI